MANSDGVKVTFAWKMARPDQRRYRQNSAELEPQQIFVVVEVPNHPQYLSSDNPITLTPFGLQFALEQLEEVFKEPEGETEWVQEKKNEVEQTSVEEQDDDWGDEEDDWNVDEEW